MQIINIRGLVFTALFAALFIVLSMQQMRLPISAIPITLQTLGIIFAGLFLKPKYAFGSIFAVILLALPGLPLFGGRGGLSHLLGPTGGFIFAFPFCAMLTSVAINNVFGNEKIGRNKPLLLVLLFLIFFVISSVLCYPTGLLWMKHVLADYTWTKTFNVALTFLPGDAIKSAFGAIIGTAMYTYIKDFRSRLQPR
ncbi:biotin transporter BioY [Paenibacillus sp. CAU 1782]